MKNNYIISGILGIAVIVLFILHFTGSDKVCAESQESKSGVATEQLPIAYIKMDSLLSNYKYHIDLNESLIRKSEDKRSSLNQKGVALQKEMSEFEKKFQNNAFLTQERAQKEYERIMNKQKDLAMLEQEMAQELGMEQMQMNIQLSDTIVASIKLFNTPQKYQMIFSNIGTQTILYADEAMYDITNDVIEFLNARYTPKAD